jgi:hypothetical protein
MFNRRGGHRAIAAMAAVLALVGCGRAMTSAPASRPEAPMAAKRQSGPAWYAVQLHAHSTISDGLYDVKTMIAMAKQEGLDALSFSEHDTTQQWLDPDFVNEKDLLLLHSMEGRTREDGNHLGIHGMTGMTPIPRYESREDVLRDAAARHATIIINHPANSLFPWKPLVLDPRVHAIEVWNSWFWAPMEEAPDRSLKHNERAIAWWVECLQGGAKVAAIAAADFHRKPQSIGSPCTLVYAQDRTEPAILAAIRAGRTVLVDTPRSERVELTADADHDGRFEALVGDTVPAGATLRVHVTGGQGRLLKVLRGRQVVLRMTVPGGDWAKELTLPASKPGDAPFVYARLDASGLPAANMRAMTSALYLK